MGQRLVPGRRFYRACQPECLRGNWRPQGELFSSRSQCAKACREGRLVSLQPILLRELSPQRTTRDASRYRLLSHWISMRDFRRCGKVRFLDEGWGVSVSAYQLVPPPGSDFPLAIEERVTTKQSTPR